MTTAAERFAAWALSLRAGDVPAPVRRAAARHLLDGTGTAIAAARTNAVRSVVEAATSWGASDGATPIGARTTLPAPNAALVNGALVHALDYDDTHAGALVHATAAVLPAAFAVGEETHATGADVLVAAIAGYEIVNRLGAAVTHGFHAHGFHASSVCGVFGSALIASRLYGLDVARTTNALGIAGSLASGSLEFLSTGSATKQLHPGFAGMNGILAARLAAAGAEGPATIFEGEHGLFRSFTGATVNAEQLTSGLGSRWETEHITIKPYPACQLSHASLDALRDAGPVAADDVDAIVFEVPPDAVPIVCEPAANKQRPRTLYEGKFSLPYCAAALLIDKALTIDAFDEEKLRRPNVLALAARIRHHTRDFDGPPADAPGIAEITLRDGRTLRGEVKQSRGTPENPLTEDEIVAKFVANCGGIANAEQLAQRILDIESVRDIGALVRETAAFA